MIDYVKVRLNDIKDDFKDHFSLLSWQTTSSDDTGEIKSSEAEYKGLKFIKDKKGFYLKGSLHKYYCDGANFSQYSFKDLSETIIDLYEKFNINPFLAYLENIEYGLNISDPAVNPSIITNNCLLHKGERFSSMKGGRKSLGTDCYHQQYGLKIYDKAKQYHLSFNLLRFEIKVIKMQLVKKFGIATLGDLLQPNLFILLADELKNRFKEIIIYNTSIDLMALSEWRKKFYLEAGNINYWEQLYNDLKEESFRYRKSIFDEIISKNSERDYKAEVQTKIIPIAEKLNTSTPDVYNKILPYCLKWKNENTSFRLRELTEALKRQTTGINPSISRLKTVVNKDPAKQVFYRPVMYRYKNNFKALKGATEELLCSPCNNSLDGVKMAQNIFV